MVALVEALAWPIITLVIVLLFRAEIRRVLKRLSNLKYKEFEANFTKGLQQAERQAQEIELSKVTVQNSSSTSESEADVGDRISRLAEISPRAAVTEAWFEVEQAIQDAAEKVGFRNRKPGSHIETIKELRRMNLITENSFLTYRQLRNLRNEAVHAPEFSLASGEAERYVDLARGFATFIKFKIHAGANKQSS